MIYPSRQYKMVSKQRGINPWKFHDWEDLLYIEAYHSGVRYLCCPRSNLKGTNRCDIETPNRIKYDIMRDIWKSLEVSVFMSYIIL